MTKQRETEPSQTDADAMRKAAIVMREMRERLNDQKQRIAELENQDNEPIAVVGMSCRMPGGANDIAGYWDVLRNGIDATGPIPENRWDIDGFYDQDPNAPGKTYTRHGGYLDEVRSYDPVFFGIAPREATSIDPQHRLLLEVSWEALEDAGIAADTLSGSLTGVFVGICAMDYSQNTIYGSDINKIDAYSGTGITFSVAAGRISYVMGLEGPSMAVDTACSSSLVTTHLAIQSLRRGECDLALAGGSNMLLQPEPMIYFSKLQAISPDGRCKTFDSSANGYARGEGCGILVLKRLSDAERDGDRVLAVLAGSAVNHDGRSGGFTVPNGPAQERVVRSALDDAGLAPEDVGYIEAHGTGTPLGDPIEVHALSNTLCKNRGEDNPLLIGSSKTNIGHLESAAGSAALIKVILAMQNDQLPPHLHFKEWNPHIDLGDSPIEVVKELRDWPKGNRVAGVSSFGISGTNAHIIVADAPAKTAAPKVPAPANDALVYPLSAKSQSALQELAKLQTTALDAKDGPSVVDAAFTAATGRSKFSHRLVACANDQQSIQDALNAAAQGADHKNLFKSDPTEFDQPKTAFLFTGQGSQYAGMGRGLYEEHTTFRATIDRCEEAFLALRGTSIKDILLAEPGSSEAEQINQTGMTQPALYCLQVALVDLWAERGVRPYAVLGHSVGEFAAAYAAGVFSLEEGLALITARGAAMQALPAGGQMAAVFADPKTVQSVVETRSNELAIAAINGPKLVVISGAGAAVSEAVTELEANGIRTQELTVSHAFHSPLMDPMLDDLEQTANGIAHAPARTLFVSTLTGEALKENELGGNYWRAHAASPVLFADGISTLADQGCNSFLEIGPNPTLCGMGSGVVSDPKILWTSSLRRGQSDRAQMNEAMSKLFARGIDVDWQAALAEHRASKVSLPTYPFEREEYWAERGSAQPMSFSMPNAKAGAHPLLGARIPTAGREAVFQSNIAANAPAFLTDHKVCGATLFPATGYWELGLAAAKAHGLKDRDLVGVALEEPLLLPEGETVTLQAVISPTQGADFTFGIYSRLATDASTDTPWRRHATGTLAPRDMSQTPANIDIQDQIDACETRIAPEEHYAFMTQNGLDYGPVFQGVRELHKGVGKGLARIELDTSCAAHADACEMHPAMLDACLQALSLAMPTPEEGSTYLPLGVDRLTLFGKATRVIWCDARLRGDGADATETLSGDVDIYDADGTCIARLEGTRLKRATRMALMRAAGVQDTHWEHALHWSPSPAGAPTDVSGDWLILADDGGIGGDLANHLKAEGANVSLVANPASKPVNGHDPQSQKAIENTMRQAMPKGSTTLQGVVNLWSLDAVQPGAQAEGPLHPDPSTIGLHIVQAISNITKGSSAPRLWCVTRGAQAVKRSATPLSASAASLWGFGRVVANELPDLNCSMIDLDPALWEDPVEALIEAIGCADDENEIAYRDGQRHTARLVRSDPEMQMKLARESVQLQIPQRGQLDDLILANVPVEAPGPDELKISVRGAGLNFRDVLNALGMYPGDPGPLGGECAGVVLDVGANVTHVKVGDPVLAIVPGCFRTEAIAKSDVVAPLPKGMNFAEAAGVPIAFLTAHYALRVLSDLQAGERVLIHAGAGGVGIAAIQIALTKGATVFTTAGSPRKRVYLRQLGVEHIFDSRALDFANDIRKITDGVDVVLNSLAGEAINHSLSLLKPGGRFVEIGKTDLWTLEKAEEEAPGVRYMPFALDDLVAQKPAEVGAALTEVLSEFASGALKPLPTRMFDLQDSIEGFRFMQQARHIGKIVLTRDVTQDTSDIANLYRKDASYLITGGAGGIGCEIASHLAQSGAGTLVLTGRSEANDKTKALLSKLETLGASAHYLRGDVADEDALARILGAMEAETLPPLAGVFHAAGVLGDGIILQQTDDSFEHVLKPKVNGAWNLHQATRDMDLDHFVLFSSVSSILGSVGQSNYAAANAYLDTLAHARRIEGLAGLAINWGPWAGAGMAAGLEDETGALTKRGVQMINPSDGVIAMDEAMARGKGQDFLMPVQWDKFLAPYGASVPPILRALSSKTTGASANVASDPAARDALMSELRSVPSANRTAAVQDVIEAHALRVLGLEASARIDPAVPLQEIGLDSLMAVELRNGLTASLGAPLPATLLFDYPTLRTVAEYIATEVLDLGDDAPEEFEDEPLVQETAALEDEGDADVEQSLLDELNDAGY
ncbi:type I polyketide synthase [Planktotalea sp.]|uniref:type I polyketide synthase n=1 Tax=Planktotalea sp. TaxID=2029877 RepID=UPI003296A97B